MLPLALSPAWPSPRPHRTATHALAAFRQHQGPSEGCTDRAGHAFVKCVMSEERLRRAIRQVPWYVLQNPYPRTLVHHFIGHAELKERELAQFARYSTPGTLLGSSDASEESSRELLTESRYRRERHLAASRTGTPHAAKQTKQ